MMAAGAGRRRAWCEDAGTPAAAPARAVSGSWGRLRRTGRRRFAGDGEGGAEAVAGVTASGSAVEAARHLLGEARGGGDVDHVAPAVPTVREVLQDLQRPRKLAYTTVMTVLARLAEKGLLGRRREGKAHAYEVTQTPRRSCAGPRSGWCAR